MLHGLRSLGHTPWLPFGARDRIIRCLYPPETTGSDRCHFSVPYYGFRYDGSLENFIDWSVWFYGAYAKFELDCIADLAQSSPVRWATCLDIGANVGTHTLFLSTLSDHVHAFEPWSPVGERILRAIDANDIANVTVHFVGLADRNAHLPFRTPSDCNLGTGAFIDESCSRGTRLELPVVRGDDYLRVHDIGNVGFIKIDTEGFEMQVLEGLQQTIQKDRPIILMELSERTRQTLRDDSSFEALLPCGYTREYLLMNSWQGYRRTRFIWDRPLSETILLRPETT